MMSAIRPLDVFPEGSCSCGKDLAGAADLGVRYSHQVTDLPDARAVTTQYDRHEVECACGRVHVAGVLTVLLCAVCVLLAYGRRQQIKGLAAAIRR